MDASSCLELLCSQRASVVLTGHENPDGDCIGSQIGLQQLLTALGVPVRIVLPDPASRTLRFLVEPVPGGADAVAPPALETFDAEQGLGPASLLVLLDCSQLSRTGALGAAWRESSASSSGTASSNGTASSSGTASSAAGEEPRVLVIDHHIGADSEGDGDFAFVDSTAAATGELVARLWDAAGRQPGPLAARAMLTALVADTGWFRYSNTDAAVFERARQFAACGVDVADLYDRLHRDGHPESVQMLGELIARSELLCEGRLGRVVLTGRQVGNAARVGLELDNVMEPLRSVAGMEVVLLVKPAVHGDRVKISLRSQGDVDVQRIAAEFGGGGHRKAAGATIAGVSAAEVAERVSAAIAAALPPRAAVDTGSEAAGS